MKVYYGNTGNSYHIMCTDTNEIYTFDMFGNLESTKGTIGGVYKWSEVDFISLVGTSNDSCEVLYNGYKSKLNNSLFSYMNTFRNYGKYLGTIFNIPHEDDLGRYNQVLFLYSKGTLEPAVVDKVLQVTNWTKLL